MKKINIGGIMTPIAEWQCPACRMTFQTQFKPMEAKPYAVFRMIQKHVEDKCPGYEAILTRHLLPSEEPVEWHNPDNLSDDQVGVKDGWRLLVKGEFPIMNDELWAQEDGWAVLCREYPVMPDYSYRTRRPLPNPTPTRPDKLNNDVEDWADYASKLERDIAILKNKLSALHYMIERMKKAADQTHIQLPISAFSWSELDYPDGEFRVMTDDDPHGKLYIVAPGGQMIDVGCHADPVTDVNRASWMVSALNYFRGLAIDNRTRRPLPAASAGDPYAELKAAHACGEVIENNSMGAWVTVNDPNWGEPVECYRIASKIISPPSSAADSVASVEDKPAVALKIMRVRKTSSWLTGRDLIADILQALNERTK